MKVNVKVRTKNIWFWVGVGGVILSAMGVSPETLTSWGAVLDMLKDFIGNPFIIVSTILAVLGVFVDPTTNGLSDSAQAMTYTAPKKENK